MSRSLRALLAGVLWLAIALPARQGIACSICLAGDPAFSSQGTTAQAQGDVSAYLEYRSWKKRSGLLPGEAADPDAGGHEDNESRRLDLYASWTPLDRLTLSVDVPVAFNEIVEVEGDERTRSHIDGLGDVALQASGVLWRNREILPSTWFEGRALLKLPTGRSHVTRGGVEDPHLQPGTGSVDFGFGLAAIHRLEWASLYTSASYRINTKGSLDYRYGDVFLANAGIEVPVGHLLGAPRLDAITPGFELNFRYAERDHVDHQTYLDSGGSILYLTPSLRLRLPWFAGRKAPSLRGSVQIPATDRWLHGFQEEDPIWFAGLYFPF